MARQGYPLKHMLDTFADLYAPRNTIEEDQKEVDNFTRKAKEPIRTAMRRFSCLVDKIRCLSNPISWPDIKYKMCKSVLKQIITIKTRQFIDYEEAKIKKVGGQFDMKELIELVNDFETSHSEVPTEDFTHRADKQDRGRSGYKKSNNQTSQQSGQARSYSKDRPQRTTSNERYRSQSGDKGQRSYSKDKGQRSYSKDKGQRSNSNTRTAEAKVNIEKEDGKIIFKNQAYYNCTCSSLHMLGQECPKSGMPIHIKN